MTSVSLPTSTMRDWAKALIWERVPANVCDDQAEAKVAALAKEFAQSPWALRQGAEVDLDELCSEAIKHCRSEGYPLLDEPPSEHSRQPEEWVRCWGPPEK
jgi:hypothetical protein